MNRSPLFPKTCPSCEGTNIYVTRNEVSARGGYGPDLLPGLGYLLGSARMHVLVCEDCGSTLFFATEDARKKLARSRNWRRVE
jgi:hypothetical protein